MPFTAKSSKEMLFCLKLGLLKPFNSVKNKERKNCYKNSKSQEKVIQISVIKWLKELKEKNGEEISLVK